MAASSSSSFTSTLAQCERLPDELLLSVLDHVMRWGGLKEWCGAVRGVSRQWRAVHDGACTSVDLLDGVTDEGMHVLCGRLPALTRLDLQRVKSLSAHGLRVVGGLTQLTHLSLDHCHVDDVEMGGLQNLTALTTLSLSYCTKCDGRARASIRSLTKLSLTQCSATKAGENATQGSPN